MNLDDQSLRKLFIKYVTETDIYDHICILNFRGYMKTDAKNKMLRIDSHGNFEYHQRDFMMESEYRKWLKSFHYIKEYLGSLKTESSYGTLNNSPKNEEEVIIKTNQQTTGFSSTVLQADIGSNYGESQSSCGSSYDSGSSSSGCDGWGGGE